MERLRPSLPSLHERYGVRVMAVFGSYVWNEQHPGSDLDLLAEFDRTLGLLEFIGLKDDLTNIAGVPVDAVSRSRLQPRIARYVVREAVAL